jgi:hypothetical protein
MVLYKGELYGQPPLPDPTHSAEASLPTLGPGDREERQGDTEKLHTGDGWENHGAAYGEPERTENVLDRRTLVT